MVCVKCVSIPLIYSDSNIISYKEFIQLYKSIQDQIRRIKNKISIDFYILQTQRKEEYETTGKWPKFSKTSFLNDEYHKYKSMIPLYQTGNLSQLITSEIMVLNAHEKDVNKGTRTIDNYKKDQPVVLKGVSTKIQKTNDEFEILISLFSSLIKQKYPMKNGQIFFRANIKSNSLKAVVERCSDSTYKICASALNYNKRRNYFELSLTYSFEHNPEIELDTNKFLGIDLGMTNAYYLATNFDDYYRFYEPGGDIKDYAQKIESRRWLRKKQRVSCGDGSIGHGYTTRNKPVLAVGDKIAGYRNLKNHLMSRKIIQEALKLGCGVIQMEDLSGISTRSKFLKNWSYYDLQQKIKQKAQESGIIVSMINPNCTSQRCSKCGYIDKANRPYDKKTRDQSKFQCLACGYKENADYNAARNIAIPNIDTIIAESRKKS